MGSIYFQADKGVYDLAYRTIEKWHGELRKADIRIGILFALSTKEDQPAIRQSGYPVDGMIKIVPLKDRITKNFDVEIILDGQEWRNRTEAYSTALIDHLLCRIELKKPKPKKPKKNNSAHGSETEKESLEQSEFITDDIGRPVLKIRPWDWNAGFGFREVVERHGDNAPECKKVKEAQVIIDASKNNKQV